MMRAIVKVAGLAVLAVNVISLQGANATTYTPTFSGPTGPAGTETFTASTGLQTTDFLAQFNIPQFDPTLGTLTEISISVGGDMSAIGSLSNTGSGPATPATISQYTTVTNNPTQPIAGSLGTSHITTGSNGGDSFLSTTISANAGVGYGSLAAGASQTGIVLASPFAGQTLTQTSGFDTNLIGSGTFGILFGTGEYTAIGGTGGNLSGSVTTQDNLTLSVTYDYTANTPSVPEPTSLSLIGIGMMGIAAAVRRRRRI